MSDSNSNSNSNNVSVPNHSTETTVPDPFHLSGMSFESKQAALAVLSAFRNGTLPTHPGSGVRTNIPGYEFIPLLSPTPFPSYPYQEAEENDIETAEIDE